jgi:surface polysaccharide O-acyltransferase-like enzyme
VVVIHVTSPAVVSFGRIDRLDWWLSLGAYTACRWAVPIFILLSGALLLDSTKDEAVGTFYRRRLWRVGVPTIFWSGFYFGWRAWYQDKPTDFDWILKALAIGSPYPHLYFLYLLAGLYLLTPFLRLFIRQATRRQQLAAVLLAFALGLGDKLVRCWFGGGVNVFWMFVPYLGYYLAGWYLRDVTLSDREARISAWVWVASVPLTMVCSRLLFDFRDRPAMRFWPTEYLSPTIVVMSLAAFLTLCHVYRNAEPRPLLKALGESMLGVYLIHPALLNLLRDAGITGIWHGALVGIPVSAALALLGGYAICAAMRAVPGLRAVVGG